MKKANIIVMTVTGLTLIVASLLKAHQVLTEPIISKGFWESWLFFVIQIPLELGLGIWLVSGLFRKAGWLIAVLAFGAFIVVTLHKGLIGAASCGCFGRVHVNPWITLCVVDIPLFLALLIFRPRGEKLLPPPWPSAKHFFGVAMPTCIVLAALVPTLIFNKPPAKTARYEVVDPKQWLTSKQQNKEPIVQNPVIQQAQVPDQNIQPLAVNEPGDAEPQNTQQTPQTHPTQQWEMLKHIDIADSLRSGIAVAVLYHYDCPLCQEAIPRYDQLSRTMGGSEDTIKFAFIEAPPYADKGYDIVPDDTSCLTGRLDESKHWYIASPLVVLLIDGSVAKSWEAYAPRFDEILSAIAQAGAQ